MSAFSPLSLSLQAISTVTGAGKAVFDETRVVASRRCNVASLATITADYGIKYYHDRSPENLAGLLNFGIITARTAFILLYNPSESLRKSVAAAAFVVGTSVAIVGQVFFSNAHSFAPITLLPMTSLGLGCMADASNSMVFRRRCFLAMGLTTVVFGFKTAAYGLVGKNLIADIAASLISMRRHRDTLPSMQNMGRSVRSALRRLGHSQPK